MKTKTWFVSGIPVQLEVKYETSEMQIREECVRSLPDASYWFQQCTRPEVGLVGVVVLVVLDKLLNMKIPANQCQYPGEEHALEDTSMSGGSCIYQDKDHGIPEMIRVCELHYKAHILKYYPDSLLAQYFRKQDEKKANQEQLF